MSADREQVRMLREDFGYSDAEIADELGCELAEVRGEVKVASPRRRGAGRAPLRPAVPGMPEVRYSDLSVEPIKKMTMDEEPTSRDRLARNAEEAAARPRRTTFRTAAGRELLTADGDSDASYRLQAQLRSLGHEERVERSVGTSGRNARPAPSVAGLAMARGAKLLRLAEAMARLRDRLWWELDEAGKHQFATLAGFALDALEVVEREEAHLRSSRARREDSRLDKVFS